MLKSRPYDKENFMKSPTKTLSVFLDDLTYEKIPLEVAERVKLVFLDTIGAALAGSQTKERMIALSLAQKLKG